MAMRMIICPTTLNNVEERGEFLSSKRHNLPRLYHKINVKRSLNGHEE